MIQDSDADASLRARLVQPSKMPEIWLFSLVLDPKSIVLDFATDQ